MEDVFFLVTVSSKSRQGRSNCRRYIRRASAEFYEAAELC